ncbi:MAG TPA: hypothetical protein VGJ95_18590 [Pseudonocardiaceae bacterium]
MSTTVTGDSSVRPLNSVAVPVTRTRSPTSTGIVLNANSPSEVAGSASGVSSWKKKPRSWSVPWKSPVTTPSTRTVLPASGEASPAPCTCAISWSAGTSQPVGGGGGGTKPLLRGLGAPATKSAPLSSVSWAPSDLRSTAVVFDAVGAAAVPSKKFAPPYPTRSLMSASCSGEHGVDPPLQASPAVEVTSTTLPVVADMLVVPVASGVGSGTPLAPPASCTSRYWPGCRVMAGSAVGLFAAKLPVPVALAYCTDQPATDAGLAPRLYNSTKSLVYGAPVLPPPPYTWLITMSGETACAGATPMTPSAVDDSVTTAA